MSQLSFKICKKLKENGFPQNSNGVFYFDEWNGAVYGRIELKQHKEKTYIPTLDELVDVLGVRLGSLVRQPDGSFLAIERQPATYEEPMVAHGSDAKEACALLFLMKTI